MPHVLITGVSTGIGRACAELFSSRGWRVTGTVRDTSRSGATRPAGVQLESLDLAVPGDGMALAERVLGDAGCPDVLVNNAGGLAFGPVESLGAGDLERLYQVNVFGQVELIRGFLPAMRARGSGVIANITSLGGRLVFPFFGGYNSSKWALEGISEALWHELRPFGVRVKAIEPGFVETAIWGKALPASADELTGPAPYLPYLRSMLAFERAITNRTTPEAAAEEILSAVTDESDRLRYPVAAYARPMVAARRILGDQAMIRFFHKRWMGR